MSPRVSYTITIDNGPEDIQTGLDELDAQEIIFDMVLNNKNVSFETSGWDTPVVTIKVL